MNRGSSPPRFRKGKNILRMTFKNFFFAFVSFFLFSSGADAVIVIENSGQSTIIESRASAVSDTGGNSGSGNIETGDARATNTTEIRSSDSGTMVSAESVAETDGQESSVSVVQKGPGTLSVEAQEGGAEARIDVSISEESESDTPPEERPGILEKVGAFLSGVEGFIRSIFE